MEFVKQLHRLSDQADEYIRQQVKEKGTILLFDVNQSGKASIVEDHAELQHNNKYEDVEYAAIYRLMYTPQNTVEIAAILKGESFPESITVNLNTLSYEEVICLADFLMLFIQNNY